MTACVSPVTGAALVADTPHSLAGQDERWPVVDGIPYLRAGSEALAVRALAALDAGDAREATALLLAENDAWWDEPPPPHEALLSLVDRKDELTLRDAMAALGWGRVGDYFAHRWSDPTFVASLALLGAVWPDPDDAFELACGIGHHLRAMRRAGAARVAGGDVVFGKLWVCRHWVCPEADLVCFDADAPWPVAPRADLMLCADAFYFLREKRAVADRLREARKVYAVAHVHNAASANYSAGDGAQLSALRDLFPDAAIFDDAALTRSVEGDAAITAPLADAAVFSLAGGPGVDRDRVRGRLLLPPEDEPLIRNPLLREDGTVAWPSARYEAEYAADATYGRQGAVPGEARMGPDVAHLVRSRDLLDLPTRW